MTIKQTRYISLKIAAEQLGLPENDTIELLTGNGFPVFAKRQLPQHQKDELFNVLTELGVGLIFDIEIFTNNLKLSDVDVVTCLRGSMPSSDAIEKCKYLKDLERGLENKRFKKCTVKEAKQFLLNEINKIKENYGNSELLKKIKMLADSVSAAEIIAKFSLKQDQLKEHSSDRKFWMLVYHLKNFDLISDEKIAEYKQIFEEPYWELLPCCDLNERNYVLELITQGKIVGSIENLIFFIQPGKTLEEVTFKRNGLCWADQHDLIYDDIYFDRATFEGDLKEARSATNYYNDRNSSNNRTSTDVIKNCVSEKTEQTDQKIEPQQENYIFRKKGDGWFIKFKETEINIRNLNGFVFLEYLLHAPNKSIEARDLMLLIYPQAADAISSDTVFDNETILSTDDEFSMEEADPKAIRACKNRLAELGELIKEAEESNEVEKKEDLQIEQKEINQHLSRVTNKKGKGRKVSNAEKFRKTVFQAISTAKNKLKEYCEKNKLDLKLYDHLKAYIKTGSQCSYVPPDEIVWK